MPAATSQTLEALSPTHRAFFLAWSLFSGESKEALKSYVPKALKSQLESLDAAGFSSKFLDAYLKKMLAFQGQSYFLGIDESWVNTLLGGLPQSPVLLEVLKTKLIRMSQYDDLLEVGKKELSRYLLGVGRQKTARLLMRFPKEIQEALIAELAKAPEGEKSELNFEFIFEFNYLNAIELFKQAGLYAKDPAGVQQLAQRLPYADGQKLMALLKK